MLSKQAIEIQILKAGSPEPYSDSEWEAIFTFTGQGTWGDRPKDVHVKALAQIVLRQFKDTQSWYEPKLEECSETEPGRWRVRIRQIYVDEHHPIWWTG